jgi:hypothetical protein
MPHLYRKTKQKYIILTTPKQQVSLEQIAVMICLALASAPS